MERLQKIMARAGIASRRHCEELIRDGKVIINGEVRTGLPILVDPEQDEICVNGRVLRAQRKVYYLLYKPRGVVSTNSDPQGRPRAIDLLAGVAERVYPVGRLDVESKGLLLLTNDGDLAHRLTHPRFGVVKTYVAEVAGRVTASDLEQLREGIYFPEGKARVERVKILRQGPQQSLVEIELREGRNRQIRRMLARLEHNVRQLTRVRIGPLTLRGLGPGKYRPLTRREVDALRELGGGEPKASSPRQRKATGRVPGRERPKAKGKGLRKGLRP